MIATSLDGQWAAVRRGREVTLFASGAGAPVGRIELESDEADIAFVGPPAMLAVVSRQPAAKVTLHQPPYLDAAARLDLDAPLALAAVSGQRMVLLSADGKQVLVVRGAGRALSSQAVDTGTPAEFAVGLERNQMLLGLLRKLEVWDAVSGRPLLRLQLQLPPPPRQVGAAQGHLWATRPGSDEVYLYRLSDGRPFRHYVGAPVDEVVCHPASPLIVLVTRRGLVRLHCFAHSLAVIDSPWLPGQPLGQLVAGDDVSLVGIADSESEPWRVPISGAGAPIVASESSEPSEPALVTAADRLRAMRERSPGAEAASTASEPAPAPVPAPAAKAPLARGGTSWREPLAAYGLELARGHDGQLPVVAVDTELGELAHRLALPAPSRRALIALYSLYLIGDPALSIARLGQALGDWTEPLGQGELGALAMLKRRGGKVGLRAAVTDLLDGVVPRSIRVVGGPATAPRPGVTRRAREGKTDAALEAELATQLGRIGVIEGAAARGVLEARLYGATAVALAAPIARPVPWPRAAGLIVVADDGAREPAWIAALPSFG
jgi:hypothetical protein